MIYNVHIKMFRGHWHITVRADALKAVGGLRSGKVYTLNKQVGDAQTQEVLIKPYYRRPRGDNQIDVFAVQVKKPGGTPMEQ